MLYVLYLFICLFINLSIHCLLHLFFRSFFRPSVRFVHFFIYSFIWVFFLCLFIRELKQPRCRRRQQKPHKFAYLTVKNIIFARFARAFFIFWHFEDVLVLSTTPNDLFCSCADDVSIWWQMFNFVFLCPKRLFQFNSRTVRTYFLSIMTLNKWKMIAEARSYIFRWRSRFRRRRVCLSSLLTHSFFIYLFIIFHIYLFCTRLEFLRWIKSRNENDESILCYFSWMPCLWFKA